MSAIRNRGLLVVVAGVIVLGGAGITAGALASNGEQPSPPPNSYAPVGRGSVQPARTAQKAIVTGLRGLTPNLFTDVYVSAPPPDEQGGTSNLWLYGTASVGDYQSATEAMWEFDLLQGVVSETVATNGSLASGISGYTLRRTYPDGTSDVYVGSSGNIAAGQRFAAATDPDATIQQRVQDVLTRYGVEAKITVLHPLGAVVKIIGTVPALADLAGKVGQLSDEITGPDTQLYEGAFISLSDSNGPFVILTAAYRSGAGGMWIRPGLQSEYFGLFRG